MKTKQVTGQEALDILNNGGKLYAQEHIYFKNVGSIYFKKKDSSLLKESILIDDDIKRLYWEAEENEPEYNLSIQQVMQRENVGKHYKMENEEILLWLSEDSDGYLELLVVEDDYTQIEDDIYLEYIVNSKYKEVQF